MWNQECWREMHDRQGEEEERGISFWAREAGRSFQEQVVVVNPNFFCRIRFLSRLDRQHSSCSRPCLWSVVSRAHKNSRVNILCPVVHPL